MSQSYNASVVQRQDLGENLAAFRIRPDEPIADFKPGQFAVLGLFAHEACAPQAPNCATPADDRLIRKAYSVSSSPARKDTLEFLISLVPDGELTPRLFALKEGDRLFLSPRLSGKFTPDRVPDGKHALFVATGTGIAPFLSMLRDGRVLTPGRRITLLHGARQAAELIGFAEFLALTRTRPDFRYIPAISRPTQGSEWPGRTGRVTALLSEGFVEKDGGLALDPDRVIALLCGNSHMINDVSAILETKGFRKSPIESGGTILTEDYGPAV